MHARSKEARRKVKNARQYRLCNRKITKGCGSRDKPSDKVQLVQPRPMQTPRKAIKEEINYKGTVFAMKTKKTSVARCDQENKCILREINWPRPQGPLSARKVRIKTIMHSCIHPQVRSSSNARQETPPEGGGPLWLGGQQQQIILTRTKGLTRFPHSLPTIQRNRSQANGLGKDNGE